MSIAHVPVVPARPVAPHASHARTRDRRPSPGEVRAAALFAAALGAATPFPGGVEAAIPQDLQLVQLPNTPSAVGRVGLRHADDGSGRLYAFDLDGTVHLVQPGGFHTVLSLAADAPPHGFATEGEGGLLGLAFHPDFPTDARLFVYYTDANHDSVIASYLVSGDPPEALPASATVVLRVDQDFTNHNGGDIHFGPDGYLYIALGDGGSGNDPCNRAQTLDPADLVLDGTCAPDAAFTGRNPESLALLGKMLRIDVDGTTLAPSAGGLCGSEAPANYAIPPGNPFAGGGTANGCDEVWHYGLRNPFRFSFDRLHGDMYIGDVGQDHWEEVDFAAAGTGGLNFGWKLCEGAFVRGSSTTPCTAAGTTLPILSYARTTGSNRDCAVTGGFRYRGPIATLNRHYLYGDFCSGRIRIATRTPDGSWQATLWMDTSLSITSFGEDEAGHLYVVDFYGSLLRLEAPDAVFGDTFEPL